MNRYIKTLILIAFTTLNIVFIFEYNNRNKIRYAEYRAEIINSCRENAHEKYLRDWNTTCYSNGSVDEFCSLDVKYANKLDTELSKEYDRCIDTYR